jgi:type IV pilus assembly protein PilW
MCRRRRSTAGVSLAEVLVGTALSLFIVGAIYSFSSVQTKALAAQRSYTEAQNVSRTVIDFLTRELRMATYDPTGNALPTSAPGTSCPGVKEGIVEARMDRIRFKQDLNGDGDVVDAGEDLTYYPLGGDLWRVDNTSATTVAMVSGLRVDGFDLRYFDNSNPPVQLVPTGTPAALSQAQRACVAKVRVTVRASLPNPSPSDDTPLQSQAQAEVAIRNRSLTNF